ncbi:IclR family transcriptional regulator domain-containing protein [Saccharopolyspora cebuensis]|uniref:IclR family transcriptional regulator domain-containing protein n=1 Tax=Saccharopolyspora cebuensis TaxID=418759 RepID=UPI0031EE5B43
MRVLDALITQPPPHGWGVRELAGVIGENRSTVNRILQGLVERRLAEVGSTATYRAGPRLRVLAGRLHARHPILSQAATVIADLAARCDATIMVVMQGPWPSTGFLAVLHEHEGPVRYQLIPGMVLPLHAGAAGKALLATIGLDVLDDVELERFGEDTIVDRERLATELAGAEQAGYVTSVGQHIPLAAGVAAPFAAVTGEKAAVSATRPRYSTSDDELTRIGPLVRDAAAALGRLRPVDPTEQPFPAAPRTSAEADTTALGRFERLLAVLADQPDGVPPGRELVSLIGASAPTVTRLRTTAEASGIARTTGDSGDLAAGPLLLRWAAALGPQPPLPVLLTDDLAQLAAATGETTALTVFDRSTTTAVMTTVVPGPNPVHYGLGAGSPIPLHAGAAGKAILAHCDRELIEKQPLDPITPRTPTHRDQLERDLTLVRDRGWAEADGERIPDAFGIAAPFFDGAGIAGSVTVTIPRFRKDELDITQLGAKLAEAAARITRLLTI